MIPRRLRKYRGGCRRRAGRRRAGGDDPARPRRLYRAPGDRTKLASRRSARSRAPNGASASRSRRWRRSGQAGCDSCADIDLDAVRRAVMSDHADQGDRGRRRGRQVAHCLPSGAGRRRRRCRANCAPPTIACSSRVVRRPNSGERALRITLAPRRRSAAACPPTFRPTCFCPTARPSTAASDPVVRVMLNEGTLIAAPSTSTRTAPRTATIRSASQNQSTRYPLIVTATVSRAAVFAEHSDLRAVGTLGGAVLALLIDRAGAARSRGAAAPIRSSRWSARSRRASSSRTTSRSSICARGAIVGAEVLMRWRKARRQRRPARRCSFRSPNPPA